MGAIPVANPSPVRRPHLSPRGLLIVALPLALLGAFAVLLAVAWPTGPNVGRARWVDGGDAEALVAGQPVRLAEQGVWLVKQESGEILALWQRDPHLGCTVPWNPDFEFNGRRGWFRNPCHSETYDLDGTCVFGPCVRGLDRFPVRIRGGRVQINAGQLIPGPPRE